MTLQERAHLVLAVAKTLYINGQATEQIAKEAERLGRALGLRVSITPRWDELRLAADGDDGALTVDAAAAPTGVEMERVSSTMRAVDDIVSGRFAPEAVEATIGRIRKTPPAATGLFALAAGAGAVALAVIFGIEHLAPAVLIFVCGGAGALLRRALGRLSANLFVQPFCAAVLAGLVGGAAVRWGLSSSLRLVAVCPCMVLVPGPHLLNSALDLVNGRIALGAARLAYAGLIVVAICVGLLLGLALLGVSLPTDPDGRGAPLWQDVIAAGVAVAAYSVFFSMPLRMFAWPVGIGMVAHALRWAALAVFDVGPATGALIACVAVALILTPISRRTHMPFAAIGFTSVVSMIPGVYLFRMASGLLQIAGGSAAAEPLTDTVADGLTATIIILAMSLGLIVPKMIVDSLSDRVARLNHPAKR